MTVDGLEGAGWERAGQMGGGCKEEGGNNEGENWQAIGAANATFHLCYARAAPCLMQHNAGDGVGLIFIPTNTGAHGMKCMA